MRGGGTGREGELSNLGEGGGDGGGDQPSSGKTIMWTQECVFVVND